ncbi:MAG: chorismate synthase [Anaerolineaceae bacterium]|jgi:chorismate synthase
MTLRFLTAGESHGPGLVAILEGLPAGLKLRPADIDADLERRQHGYGAGPRMKLEQDRVELLSGVLEGVTTGAPLALWIANRDHEHWRGRAVDPFTIPRPGHADLSGAIKYGYHDLRPALERASARETAARVAVGAVCRRLLAEFGIVIGGYVAAIGGIAASLSALPLSERITRAAENEVACPDPLAAAEIKSAIRQAMLDKDTLGGIIEVAALNLPPGLGSFVHWDRKLDARLGAAVLSIPAIKGVAFGPAFENAAKRGTQTNDPVVLHNGALERPSLLSGGLEAGVTTGQPLLVRAAMKPIPTTLAPQPSVDLASGEPVETRYERSDFCPVPRAVVIVEAMLAFVLADALLEKLGGDSLDELRPRYSALRRAHLDDLKLDGAAHTFWPKEEGE